MKAATDPATTESTTTTGNILHRICSPLIKRTILTAHVLWYFFYFRCFRNLGRIC